MRCQPQTIVRVFIVYKPFAMFAGIGGVTFSVGFALVTGFVSDLVASNRKPLERLDRELQRLRHE